MVQDIIADLFQAVFFKVIPILRLNQFLLPYLDVTPPLERRTVCKLYRRGKWRLTYTRLSASTPVARLFVELFSFFFE